MLFQKSIGSLHTDLEVISIVLFFKCSCVCLRSIWQINYSSK